MVALARSCSMTVSGSGIPATVAGPERGTSTTMSGLGARLGGRLVAVTGLVGALAELDERVGGAVVAAVPGLTLGRAHLLDHLVDGVLEQCAVEIGQLAAEVEHPGLGVRIRPPHPQVPGLAAGPALRRRGCVLAADGAGQVHRCHVRRPAGPLCIRRLIGELCDRTELFAAQPPRVRGVGHMGQVLECPGGLLGLPGGALRHAVVGGHLLVERVPLVQYPGDRESLHPQPAFLAHQLGAARPQPLGRPAAQLIEMVPVVEHGTSQTRGYDTYRPDRKNRIERPKPSPEKEAVTP